MKQHTHNCTYLGAKNNPNQLHRTWQQHSIDIPIVNAQQSKQLDFLQVFIQKGRGRKEKKNKVEKKKKDEEEKWMSQF